MEIMYLISIEYQSNLILIKILNDFQRILLGFNTNSTDNTST